MDLTAAPRYVSWPGRSVTVRVLQLTTGHGNFGGFKLNADLVCMEAYDTPHKADCLGSRVHKTTSRIASSQTRSQSRLLLPFVPKHVCANRVFRCDIEQCLTIVNNDAGYVHTLPHTMLSTQGGGVRLLAG